MILFPAEYFETEDVHDYAEIYQMTFNSNNVSSRIDSAPLNTKFRLEESGSYLGVNLP